MINLLIRGRQRSEHSGAPPGSGAGASPLRRTLSEDTLYSSSWPMQLSSGDNATEAVANALTVSLSQQSLVTSVSTAETIVDLVLGHAFAEFNLLRTLPVVSFLFKKGLFIFPSDESLAMFKSKQGDLAALRRKGLAMPVLQMSVPMMAAFKRNYPNVVFHRLFPPPDDSSELQKVPYCQVFAKYLKRGGVTRFILKFTPNGRADDPENFQTVMFSASHSPSTDCLFRGSKMRWTGTTQMGATRGSGFFKLMVLNENSPSLVDGVDPQDTDPTPPVNNVPLPHGPVFVSELPPVTRFSDKSSTTIPSKGLIQIGDVKLIEVLTGSDPHTVMGVDDCSLVLTCMSLVLRDQEARKNNGNARYYDPTLSGTMFY